MNKLFFIFILAATSVMNLSAEKNYSKGQQAVRDNIMSYLKDEGYQPTIDDDGDIKFKRQGDPYFISVSDSDSDPYYVRLTKYFDYGEKVKKSNVAIYAQEVNKYKMVKLLMNDNVYFITAEMFLINSVSFTSIFERVLKVMDGAEKELQ